ncbi:hypothetical protein [Streptomyces sp. NPDC053079]|uniref:hypothetical protein n=1 Tax=Streptomyces sp. NPDC053079 TaxID=3365697 RepID=UPI0037D7B4B3
MDRHTGQPHARHHHGGAPARHQGPEQHPHVPPMAPADGRTPLPEAGPDPAAEGNATAARTPHGDGPLLPPPEREQLDDRLQEAMSGFIDTPRGSVEEADALVDALSTRVGELLEERRHSLRRAWHDDAARPGTEELRMALLGYRDLTARLLGL